MYLLETLDKATVDSWPIVRSGLPTRAVNALTAGDVDTIGELRAMDEEALCAVPGLGTRSMSRTVDFLGLCARLTSPRPQRISLEDVFGYFLDPCETQTLERRYALNAPALVPLPRGATLQQIASDLGVTRERVRQMEERGLTRLSSLCGRAFLSGLHRVFLECLTDHQGAMEPQAVAENIDESVTVPYRPASVLRLLCDCMGGMSLHNGFFSIAPVAALATVEEQAVAYLLPHAAPQPARSVHDAVGAALDHSSPAVRDHVLAMTLRHAPGVAATCDDRYFLPRAAAGGLAAELMADHEGEFHFQEVQTRFNALVRHGSRKGTRFILDMMNHDGRFERTRSGYYRLRGASTPGVASCA